LYLEYNAGATYLVATISPEGGHKQLPFSGIIKEPSGSFKNIIILKHIGLYISIVYSVIKGWEHETKRLDKTSREKRMVDETGRA